MTRNRKPELLAPAGDLAGLRAALRFGWKKAKLLEAIESQAWLHSSLDEQAVSCYTEEKEATQESECDEEDTLCVPRKYLPQPDG